jgi:anaerobic magnesium-protoporphyrin IX monomethyl ester cyclase
MKAAGASPRVLLYQPRSPGSRLPLSLLHVGSGVTAAPVTLVDGRLEMAPAARVAELAPHALCLGVTTPSGAPLLDALEATRAARAVNPKLPIIWGGAHASFLPEQCLATGAVDACVVGPGERTFAEITSALGEGGTDHGVPGVAWLRGSEVTRSLPRPAEDVNHLPPANYSLLDLESHFRFRGARRLEFCTSRGASRRLGAGHPAEESDWSGLTAERVVAQVTELAVRNRVSEIAFTDLGFFDDVTRVEAIGAGFLAARASFTWEAEADPAALAGIPRSAFPLLAESGCRRIRIWATSVEPDPLLEIASTLRLAGIGVLVAFVAGRPGETRGDLGTVYATAKKLRRSDPSVETLIHAWSPFPGCDRTLAASKLRVVLPAKLEDWAAFGLDQGYGPWTPTDARRAVPRWNFHLDRAFSPPGRRLGQRLVRRLSRLRVAVGFFGLDFERGAIRAVRQVKAALGRRTVPLVED